jgi:phage-related baseplate assembly protein
MSLYNAIDLSLLPAPDVVEALDFETILAEMIADLQARDPAYDALLESDPAYKILETAAYRELLLRQRVNEAARAVMLAYAIKTDLDNVVARFNVERLIIDPGDPEAVPPVEPTYESDTELRRRCLLALEAITTAGSSGSYVFHALSADANVLDASVDSPNPGEVELYILSRDNDGAPTQELLDIVDTAVSDEYVRPLTDQVAVSSGIILQYVITADLTIKSGASSELVRAAAEAAVTEYADNQFKLGATVALSGIYAALHQPSGVEKATLSAPAADIETTVGQAPRCTAVTVNATGI